MDLQCKDAGVISDASFEPSSNSAVDAVRISPLAFFLVEVCESEADTKSCLFPELPSTCLLLQIFREIEAPFDFSGSSFFLAGARCLSAGHHLRLTRGPAKNRTTTGSLSASPRTTPYQLSRGDTFDFSNSSVTCRELNSFFLPNWFPRAVLML